jgi:hypothetical protein
MAAPPTDVAGARVQTQTRRQNALADIQFASIIDDGYLTLSDDETPEERSLQLENVPIGVSIGEQQTRLTSPKTPAAEKAAALEDYDGGALFDGWEQHATAVIDQRTRQRNTSHGEADDRAARPHVQAEQGHPDAPTRLPSPWRAGPKTFQEKMNDHRQTLRNHLNNRQRRASSGGSMSETMRKYVPNLPSMPRPPKHLQLSLSSLSTLSLDNERGRIKPGAADYRRRIAASSGSSPGATPQYDGVSGSKLGHRRSLSQPHHARPSPSPNPLNRQRSIESGSDSTISQNKSHRQSYDRSAPALRRSNSEGSLLVSRTRSIASSLGDDSRFESVSEQVNSRLKAIKDSWQDSNFKLPSPSLSNFTFSHRDDTSRFRNGSAPPKGQASEEGSTQKLSFRTTPSTSFTRNTSSASLLAMRPFKETSAEAEPFPFFSQALQELEGDLVILGGYRGSILRSAEPPNRQLWVPIKVGLNLRKVDLEVPLDPDADERMEESIIPDGMLTNIGPIDISKRLFKRLRASENSKSGKLRVHNYGYDWRLSPHFLARRMIKFLESLPCNNPDVPREKRGAIVVAHSLGGLITRHVINQRPDLVSGVVYAGVPQNCVNILGPFRNGDDVLFSSRVLTAQVNFTIRTSYALLPLDGKCFLNKHTKEQYPVDFFDVNTWIDGALSPCVATPLPRPEQPKDSNLSVSGLLNAMSQALPTFPSRKGSISKGSQTNLSGSNTSVGDTIKEGADKVVDKVAESGAQTAGGGMEPQMMSGRRTSRATSTSEPNPATTVTIPRDKAIEYLTRVLAETKRFKEELAHEPAHEASNSYPPIALMYGKSTPTVYGAKVESREVISRADVYDELAFASGDGVVLARAAMVPKGYAVVRGGVVSSDRGHVTLLGDLEGVGRCLLAVMRGRRAGVGTGVPLAKEGERKGSEGLGVEVPQVEA